MKNNMKKRQFFEEKKQNAKPQTVKPCFKVNFTLYFAPPHSVIFVSKGKLDIVSGNE